MIPFTIISGPATILDGDNIDTDRIVPARFLRKSRADGYGKYLFFDARRADPNFPLTPSNNADILLAGANFGCGSSREAAVYALSDAGIRCVIAPSFGDIFAGNATKNGLLTIVLQEDRCAALREAAAAGAELTVDLRNQQIRAANSVHPFEIDPFRKRCLLEGLDDIGLTLANNDAIAAFEAADRSTRPWSLPNR